MQWQTEFRTTLKRVLELERAWLTWRANQRDKLDYHVEKLFDYGFRIARLTEITTCKGDNFDLREIVCIFREWFIAHMANLQRGDVWQIQALEEFAVPVASRIKDVKNRILTSFNGFSEEWLDEEICQKKLVLSLGGGGGTGYAHVSLFQILAEHHFAPSFISGTSIGAILGYFRAMQSDYDPALAALRVPSWLTLAQAFHIFTGGSRHGLPSLAHFQFDSVIAKLTHGLCEKRFPTFNELRIPFACVSTGILQGKAEYELDLPKIRRGIFSKLSKFTPNRIINTCKSVFQYFIDHPDLVKEVVFGLDEQTSHLQVIDAIGFSAMVPGVLNYEVPTNHYQSREILDDIFKREHLWRLTDGGLVNNVPSNVAYRAIQEGRLRSRNAFLLAIDVFAPIPNKNAIFIPIQQLSVQNVQRNLQYADCTCKLRDLLSPLNLAPNLTELQRSRRSLQREIGRELEILRYALTRIPRCREVLCGFDVREEG